MLPSFFFFSSFASIFFFFTSFASIFFFTSFASIFFFYLVCFHLFFFYLVCFHLFFFLPRLLPSFFFCSFARLLPSFFFFTSFASIFFFFASTSFASIFFFFFNIVCFHLFFFFLTSFASFLLSSLHCACSFPAVRTFCFLILSFSLSLFSLFSLFSFLSFSFLSFSFLSFSFLSFSFLSFSFLSFSFLSFSFLSLLLPFFVLLPSFLFLLLTSFPPVSPSLVYIVLLLIRSRLFIENHFLSLPLFHSLSVSLSIYLASTFSLRFSTGQKNSFRFEEMKSIVKKDGLPSLEKTTVDYKIRVMRDAHLLATCVFPRQITELDELLRSLKNATAREPSRRKLLRKQYSVFRTFSPPWLSHTSTSNPRSDELGLFKYSLLPFWDNSDKRQSIGTSDNFTGKILLVFVSFSATQSPRLVLCDPVSTSRSLRPSLHVSFSATQSLVLLTSPRSFSATPVSTSRSLRPSLHVSFSATQSPRLVLCDPVSTSRSLRPSLHVSFSATQSPRLVLCDPVSTSRSLRPSLHVSFSATTQSPTSRFSATQSPRLVLCDPVSTSRSLRPSLHCLVLCDPVSTSRSLRPSLHVSFSATQSPRLVLCDPVSTSRSLCDPVSTSRSLRPSLHVSTFLCDHLPLSLIQTLLGLESFCQKTNNILSGYLSQRSSLLEKCSEYPDVHDYKYALVDLDDGHYRKLHNVTFLLRDSYITFLNRLLKTFERIRRLRRVDGTVEFLRYL
ncbi:unnamed protein product [Acanthosepion pharaonis]|uniref:Proteasome activator PA28 C-terminal domain-containing protein n=1 Tax=Acanthosepion pharaonis TaxID=158019 RepID=A0A812AYF1_ACAPH|nr:unnamed protein product [Sepia pharaonis]